MIILRSRLGVCAVLALVLAGRVGAVVLEVPVERRLTNVRGGFVDARVVEVTDTDVKVVRLSDQSEHTVPLAGLSEADRAFAAVVLATGKAPVEPPPPPAPVKPYREAYDGLNLRDGADAQEALEGFFAALEKEWLDTYAASAATRVWSAAGRASNPDETKAWVAGRVDGMLKRTDLQPGQREALHLIRLQPKAGGDPAAWRAELDAFTKAVPEAKMLPTLELRYANALQKTDAAAGKAHLEALAKGANAAVATAAAKELEAWEKIGQAGPVSTWRFTAVDGREVDIGKLRGKVVVVHFWASWSQASVKEAEILKTLYATHREKGLEIVGIALEYSRPTAAEAVEKFKGLVKERGFDWPQYTEAAGWGTIYARALGIRNVPYAVVLDKEGKPHEERVRGEAIGKLVEELLGK